MSLRSWLAKTLFPGNRFTPSAVGNWENGLERVQPGNFVSQVQAYQHYIYICANLNARAVANVPVKLYARKKSSASKLFGNPKKIGHFEQKYLLSRPHIKSLARGAAEIVEITDHPFLDLLRNVNPFMNAYELWELTQLYLELTGNAYWYVVKNGLGLPAEIWVVPSQHIRIIPSQKDFIQGYVYRATTLNVTFAPDEIVHFKFANPNDLYYGASPLSAVADAYNIMTNMHKYENALFTNNGTPAGVLETGQDLSQEAMDKLKKEWNRLYGGVRNAGKTAVLDNGLSYKPIALSPREMSFLQGRKLIAEEIASAYGIPLSKIWNLSANRANGETGENAYQADTVMPRLTRLEQKINEQLIPLYDGNLFAAFADPRTVDREKRIEEVTAFIASGFMTRNELRAQEGLDPLPPEDGDVVPPLNGNQPLAVRNQQRNNQPSADGAKGEQWN